MVVWQHLIHLIEDLSCCLTDSMPPPRPECRFPIDYQGEWMQFEQDRKESVTIASGEITFSNLGHFICKTKHWAINRYKLMSVFANGWYVHLSVLHSQYPFLHICINFLSYGFAIHIPQRLVTARESWNRCNLKYKHQNLTFKVSVTFVISVGRAIHVFIFPKIVKLSCNIRYVSTHIELSWNCHFNFCLL